MITNPRSFPKLMSMTFLAMLLAILVLRSTDASEQIVCPFAPGNNWSATNPQVNQNHIFCGEWHSNRPKGFHSRPNGVNPATVVGVRNVTNSNAVGVYNMEWEYAGHAGQWKNSTMFPDNCDQQEVLNSIVHAANNQVQCQPNVPWGNCGMNRPANAVANFCVGTLGAAPWQIRFAHDQQGRVNTAFPNR